MSPILMHHAYSIVGNTGRLKGAPVPSATLNHESSSRYADTVQRCVVIAVLREYLEKLYLDSGGTMTEGIHDWPASYY